jgi:ABC-type transport system involved in cytochrome c biogenesis permease component
MNTEAQNVGGTAEELAAVKLAPPRPAAHWGAQLRGILRLEVRKNLLGARVIPLLLLAALPVGLLILQAVLVPMFGGEAAQQVDSIGLFAGLYRIYFLKVAIFASCLVVFVQLFRGDLMDRSLHYYFLCPVRRELLVVAKFLAGLTATALVLSLSTAASFLLAVLPFSSGGLPSGALGQLFAYSGITVLACVGYGAVFMLAGLFFRNPVIPALALFAWELLNPFLPAVLKQVSVIYYLSSLLPVEISAGPFVVLSDLASPWVAIPGLLLVAAVAVAAAALRIRRMEITYSDD